MQLVSVCALYSKLMTQMIYWDKVPLEQNPFSCLGRFPVWWRLCGHFQGFVCVSECETVCEIGRQRGWGGWGSWCQQLLGTDCAPLLFAVLHISLRRHRRESTKTEMLSCYGILMSWEMEVNERCRCWEMFQDMQGVSNLIHPLHSVIFICTLSMSQWGIT